MSRPDTFTRACAELSTESLAAKMIGVGFDGLSVTPELRSLVRLGVRHVVLFTRNIDSAGQVSELTREIKSLSPEPIAICVDQEGGRVMRLRDGFTDLPAMRDLGRCGDAALAFDIGRVLGTELRAVNVDVDFAPVLDVDSNTDNPVIADRSLGSDASIVSELGSSLIEGIQSAGVAACAKHFPGHGDTSQDSHHMLPRLAHSIERLHSVELKPFKSAIATGVASIMSAHVIFEPLDPDFPATMSPLVLDQILRKQLGFTGVVFSDDLEMKAIAEHFGVEESVPRCIRAGIDVMLICHHAALQHVAVERIVREIESRSISIRRLRQSSDRIDALASKFVRPAAEKLDLTLLATEPHRTIAARVRAKGLDVKPSTIDPTEIWRA